MLPPATRGAEGEVHANRPRARRDSCAALDREETGLVFPLPRSDSRQEQIAGLPPVGVEETESCRSERRRPEGTAEESREAGDHTSMVDSVLPLTIDRNALLDSTRRTAGSAGKQLGAPVVRTRSGRRRIVVACAVGETAHRPERIGGAPIGEIVNLAPTENLPAVDPSCATAALPCTRLA